MPVSPEQRKILLERLEMARKVKAEKNEKPLERKKKVATVVEEEPAALPEPEPIQPPVPAPASAPPKPQPRPQPPVEERVVEPHKTNNKNKNKYMKVVFYSEPAKKKIENLLKSLDDDASDEPAAAAAPLKNARVPATKKPSPAAKKPAVKIDNSLDEMARLYFS